MKGTVMIVKQFHTGGDRNFGYLVADEVSGEAMVVDASFNPGIIVRFAAEQGYVLSSGISFQPTIMTIIPMGMRPSAN